MVATVTRLSEAASTVHYFEADGYYAKNDVEHRKASRWYGKGIEALGLHGPVKPKRFEEILSGRIPGTATRLGRLRGGKHEHRPGLDITFSAPKSVSLEALVHAAPKASARIIRAHDEAVTATLDFIENELLETRGWDPATRKRPRIQGHGLVAATFRHYASRNLDPQLHTHSVVANMTQNSEGEWRSADFIRLERAKLLIGAHYRSELKRRLEALGYATEQTMVGSVPGFEIAGYDRATLKAFSTRRAEALAWVKDRNLDDRSAAVMQQAVLYTRKRKDEPSRKELSNIWKARMAELAPRNRRVSRGRSASHTRLDRERWHLERRDAINRQSPSALHAVRRAVEHLEERRTVFTANMLRALALAPGRWTLPEIDGAIARLREEGHLVEAIAARSDLAFVTDKAVTAERAVLRWMKKKSDAPASFAIDADHVLHHLEAGALNDGQKAAVSTLLLSSRHVCGVQGHAGTGKTTMLKQVVELAGAERIVALAPSSSAARTLQRETGLGTKTLQWFLTRYRDVGDGCADDEALARAREALEGTLLVVDEASFVSMAQMHGLARITQATGIARVALVGDKAQLRSVEAGQPFRVLQKAGMETAVMDEVLRQRGEGLKAAVLHMIDLKPDLAIEELGPGVLEMDADELGGHAAALWLDLDRDARETTKVLAPTHVRRREITGAIREGLKAEGSLHGRTLEIERYVNLHLTRAQKGDLANWREGDVAVFHADVYGVQAKSGDIFGVVGAEGEKVLLRHPDGKTRRVDPSKYLRYRVDLFETEAIELQAGERIRWTRNDKERSLLNGEEARVLWIGAKTLRLQTADGRTLNLAHDDPQLHFIDHAWTSTVHAAQGITCDQVIAVLDANQGAIAGQAAFYVELSRARDNAVLLTDDRDGLVEALETATGDELSALEAIGHQFRNDTAVAVVEKEAIPAAALSDAKAWRQEVPATLTRHLDARLAEREVLLDRTRHPNMDENSALAGVDGHAEWRAQTLATVEAWRDEMGDERGDGAGKADLLGKLVAFDDRLAAFNRDLQRHARAANAAGEDFVFRDGIDDLMARGRALVDTAPRPEEVPWDHLNFLEMATAAIEEHDQAVAEAEALALFDRVEAGLDAVRDERRALRDLAQGQPLHGTEGYAAWRERAVAAIDAWQRADVWEGERERTWFVVTARLEEALKFDDEVAALLADWAAFEKQAGERGMEALDLVTDHPLLTRVRRLVDAAPEGETPPRALTGILACHQARIEERENAAAQIDAALDDHALRHATLHDTHLTQAVSIRTWRVRTKEAIDTWRAMTMAGERDPALSGKATVLEDLIAFEERAFGVAVRLSKARGDDGKANPFLGAPGEALAADLRSLQTGVPRSCVLLSSLQAACGELDRHETRIAERDHATARIGAALDDYASRHTKSHDLPWSQAVNIMIWCSKTKVAIDTWRAMTETAERDPAISETATVLEDLIAFEKRALNVDVRLGRARGDDGKGNPFLGAEGDALARDLRSLQTSLPRHGVLLSSLQAASEELRDHVRSLARSEKRQRVAAAIEGALDDYAIRHGQLRDRPSTQARSISTWCAETREAIDTWRAMTKTDGRDPALSTEATVLENIIAFEERAHDLHLRWRDLRTRWEDVSMAGTADGTASPFLTPGGDALAADLRTLKADLPHHGVMLSSLQQAHLELDRHETRIAERENAVARVARALDDYRARHATHHDRPFTQARSIGAWCGETREAIDTWRGMTKMGGRDPVLSDAAMVLENVIAFEERAHDLHLRWRDLRTRWEDVSIAGTTDGTASPFQTPGGESLAADLRTLKADLPHHGVMLSSLRQASGELDRHETRIAERENAAARVARALDAYRVCHEPTPGTMSQLSRIRTWCAETKEAIGAWRAMTDPGIRDPELSNEAVVLENLIAFEMRAFDVAVRSWNARRRDRTASLFLGEGGEALAADLRALQTRLPRHAMMPHELRPALAALAEHDRSVDQARELLGHALRVDDARRALLEREGRTSRPLNRRFNKAWKRWREAAEAVVAEIDAADAALIARVDGEGLAKRVRAEYTASDRLDCLPGWLLLRLHDNAVAAGATMHPAMTKDYAEIMQEMYRLEQGLKQKDPRCPVLRGEINRHNENHETRRRVASLLGELQSHIAEAASLDGAARGESLPVQQSMAWATWHDRSRRLEDEARKVLAGREHRVVLNDGQGTVAAFEEALSRFEKTRAAHGEPDDSARLERARKENEEMVRAQSRRRGGGLSM